MTTAFAPYDDDTRRAERLLKNGKRVGIVGLIVLLVGGAMLGTGLFRVFKGLSQTRERLTIEVAVPGSNQVRLASGTYDVVAIGNGLIESDRSDPDRGVQTRRTNYPVPTVTITNSSGRSVTRTGSSSSFHYSNNDYDLVSMGSFRVDTTDTYRIEVNGEPGPVQTIGIGPSQGTPGGALALGGGAVLALGGLIIAGGIALYLTGRSRQKRHLSMRSPMPGWPPAPGPPGHASGPQGGPPSGPWTSPPPPPPPPADAPPGPIS